MIGQDDLFKAPPDSNRRISRYVDFTKLVSMLHTESLFFCHADKLSAAQFFRARRNMTT
jgi:hypothetical protein